MLFTRGGTYFWEGGVLGAPIGATLLALFGRPASNIIMLLIFLLGLMFFFAITPADVVLFVDGQYKTLQAKREERAAAETAYDTRLFEAGARGGERRKSDRCAAGQQPPAPSGLRRHRGHEPFPETDPRPPRSGRPPARPVTPAVPEAPFAAKPAAQTHASFDVDLGPSAGENARQRPSALTRWSRSASARAARS